MAKVVGLPLTREVTVYVYNVEQDDYEAQVVKVRKLPLGEAAKLGQALDKIPEQLQSLSQNEQVQELLAGVDVESMDGVAIGSAIVEFLPTLLNVATELIIEILAIGSGADKELLEQVGLEEATNILVAIFEVNNLQAIWGNVQKLRRMFSKQEIPVVQKVTKTKKQNG